MSTTTCSCADLPRATLITPGTAAPLAAAVRLANRYAVQALEEVPDHLLVDGLLWKDTRPTLDPREHSPELIDMVGELIDYAVSAGLATRHPQHPHLLRLALQPQQLAKV